MRRSVLFLILAIFLFVGEAARAQQDAQFSQYMFNTLFYNPAFAGVEGVTKLTAAHRSQWAGYSATFDAGGAPSTQLISLNAPLFRLRSGVGIHLVNDKLGPLTNQEVQVSYAYHLGFKNSKMSFGIRTGIFSQSINRTLYRPNQNPDPLIAEGEDSQVRPDLALGVYFRSEKVYVGASFNHLLKAEFDFGNAASRNALENHVIFTAGYNYDLSSYNLVITPSVLVKSDFNEYIFDLGFITTYKEKMWGGLSFRQSEAAIIMLGYSLLKDNSLKFGYSFDYVFNEQEAKEPTSHEFFVSYQLPAIVDTGKKIIRTPRFRHDNN